MTFNESVQAHLIQNDSLSVYLKLMKRQKILESSIKLGGASIKDFSNDGKKGDFQQYFSVYGRKGEICSNIDCNQLINKSKISNRATFFCKFCQK